jgi:hypothetical protein
MAFSVGLTVKFCSMDWKGTWEEAEDIKITRPQILQDEGSLSIINRC